MGDIKLEMLSSIIDRIVEHSYGWIYLQDEHPWNGQTLRFLHLTSKYGEPKFEDVYPNKLTRPGLQKIMLVSTTNEVIYNAIRQDDDVTVHELADCFNHFYEYDGFLDLRKR